MTLDVLLWLLVGVMLFAWLGVVAFGPPYVPTLKKDLDKVVDFLELNARDHVVDLGAGDGRVLLAAVQMGARASGVEMNPFLVWIARFRLRGYRRLATVVQGDMWRYKLPEDASIVFVFFAETFMSKLDNYLATYTKQGLHFRLVSYGFLLPNRTPSHVVGAFNVYDF